MDEYNAQPNFVEPNPKPDNKKYFNLLLIILFVVAALKAANYFPTLNLFRNSNYPITPGENPFNRFLSNETFDIEKFKSVEEFKEYLAKSPEPSFGSFGRGDMINGSTGLQAPIGSKLSNPVDNESSYRYSSTNVQVSGIDEPDIVKVNEKNIFTSFAKYSYGGPLPIILDDELTTSRIMPPKPDINNVTEIFNAFPPTEIQKIGDIDKVGNLLLTENTLIVFTTNVVYSYDVSNPSTPKELWNIPYEEKTTYKDARLYNNEIFLITSTRIDRSRPCPYYPIKVQGVSLDISCIDIYHPITPVSTELTYTIFKIDSQSGKVQDKISFLAGSQNSVLYMSEKNIFLTYTYSEDYVKILIKFVEETSDFFPPEVKEKITKLASYDLSNQTKLIELETILAKYKSELSDDESMRFENELQNKMETFVSKHVREFQTTGIIRIPVSNLRIASTGKVPGKPLNQFSLDEYKNNLRIATNSGPMMFGGTQGDVNDVYVLNNNLNVTGAVRGLGENERIYSARFIGDKGYIVTFRETDPFYVLDLSDPYQPEKKGELKIPGYSSYLHPISEDLIVGVGKEESNVKLSLFNVSDSANPLEDDKYTLNEYWSEAISNHHAFLMDTKHKIFFMPGSKGGYIFSYDDNKLSLKKTVSSVGVKRAVYINDYLYIIGENGIVVLDEKTWEEVGNLEF